MENTATFENFIDIGEKVFEHLDFKTILNCKLVCQSWNQIVANPMFWMKKLKKMGQSSEASKKWIDLISKSKELEVSTMQITKALIIMHKRVTKLNNYISYISKENIEKSKKNFLTQPPIVSAATLGLMDVMEVLAQMGQNFDQIYLGHTITGWYKHGLPLIFAFEAKNFEVVDFVLSKMSTPLLKIGDGHGLNVFNCAIKYGHLDLVKRMTPMMNVANDDETAVWLAILHGQFEVLKHLTPHLNQLNIEYGIIYAMIRKSINAVKVLLPYAHDQTMKSVYKSEISKNKGIWNIITEELKRRNIKKFIFAP